MITEQELGIEEAESRAVDNFFSEQGINPRKIRFIQWLYERGLNDGQNASKVNSPSDHQFLRRIRFVNSFPPEDRVNMWGIKIESTQVEVAPPETTDQLKTTLRNLCQQVEDKVKGIEMARCNARDIETLTELPLQDEVKTKKNNYFEANIMVTLCPDDAVKERAKLRLFYCQIATGQKEQIFLGLKLDLYKDRIEIEKKQGRSYANIALNKKPSCVINFKERPSEEKRGYMEEAIGIMQEYLAAR